MAIVQWSDLGNQLYGRQGGSAIGQQGNNPTLIRNPTAARNLRNVQQFRRWSWSEAQRLYKTLDAGTLATLTTCGQNNPYVNSRGQVRYPNRYHKWLQVAVFWNQAVGGFDPHVQPNASPGADWFFTDLAMYAYFNPFIDRQVIYYQLQGNYVSGELADCCVNLYISKVVGNGVTAYSGSWVAFDYLQINTQPYDNEIIADWWARPYFQGDTLIFRADVIDMVRGFVISSQQQRYTLLGEP